jgi:hypothetical protein
MEKSPDNTLNIFIVAAAAIIIYSVFINPQKQATGSEILNGVIPKPANPIQKPIFMNECINYTDNELNLKICPKASYQVYAMVMSKTAYYFGWESKLAPYDLALAWEKLMLPQYQQGINYSQSNRWYYYRYDAGYPLDIGYISSHSSNHHIIPANRNIRQGIDRVRSHDKVYLEGYLVYIDGSYNQRNVWWHSSLSRNDTGDGACEIMYVTLAAVGSSIYK